MVLNSLCILFLSLEQSPSSSPVKKRPKTCKWGDECSTRVFIAACIRQSHVKQSNSWTADNWNAIAKEVSEELLFPVSVEMCKLRRKSLYESLRNKVKSNSVATWNLYDDVLKMRNASPATRYPQLKGSLSDLVLDVFSVEVSIQAFRIRIGVPPCLLAYFFLDSF